MQGRIGAVRRAMLYITRRKTTSIQLFAILFVLMTLVMTGISVERAAEDTVSELRRTVGAYFKMEENLDYKSQRDAMTDELIDQISQFEGVRMANKMGLVYFVMPELTLKPGRHSAERGERAKLARFLSCSDSSYHEYFLLHAFELVSGRHIQPGDTGKAVISSDLAERNGLAIGDTITGTPNPDDVLKGRDAAEKEYQWEIVGIFAPTSTEESNDVGEERDLVENFIFVDTTLLMEAQTDMNPISAGKYREATFFVDDPEQLDALIEQTRSIPGVNWDSLKLTVNDKAYNNAAVPLRQLAGYLQIFLLVMIVIGVILLILILTMWMYDRVREIGILLAMGMRKVSLFGQHLVEVFVILLFALLLSYPVTYVAADYVGNNLLENFYAEQKNATAGEESDEVVFTLWYEPIDLSKVANADTIVISVGAEEFLLVAVYGAVTSFFAVSVSSLSILRRKPMDILFFRG